MGKKRFYCKALHGKSSYNIAVNSDMTVSCNCMDYFGNGRIGNLRENSLREIFDGEAARKLRSELFEGKIPIPECKGCPELAVLDDDVEEGFLEEYQTPSAGIMVENTVVCNYKCLNCNRIDLMKTRGRKSMALEDMQIVSREVRDNGIKLVHFFNLGEPFLSKTILDELTVLRSGNRDLKINTSTHGMLLDTDSKREAALLMNHVFFSIDGSDQSSVEKYQVGANFERSFQNMKDLASYRNEKGCETLTIEWKYVVFPWNSDKSQIDRARELAADAKVDILSFFRGGGEGCYSSAEFARLPSLKGVGFVSWRGREIDFRLFDYAKLESLKQAWVQAADSSKSEFSLGIINELVACIENSSGKSDSDFVRDTYRALLERDADGGGLKTYTQKLADGELARTDVVSILLGSEEAEALLPKRVPC